MNRMTSVTGLYGEVTTYTYDAAVHRNFVGYLDNFIPL